MALLHEAELRPTKLELLEAWAPAQTWFEGDADAPFVRVDAYRFDDPEGAVGIETLLVRAGDGPLLQVPLTYRDAQLDGADSRLITTMQHSVLGERWVYDATGDPAHLAAVATATLSGGRQADQYVQTGDQQVFREPSARVVGSGNDATAVFEASEVWPETIRREPGATIVEAGPLRVAVARVLSIPGQAPGALEQLAADGAGTAPLVLTGTWNGHPEPTTLIAVAER